MLERNLTPALAFKKKSLAQFRKENPESLYLVIETLLVKLAMSLNIGKNLEQWQITELAGDICQKYYFYSLEEIILVFKKGRIGEFGQLYDRLDSSVVMAWFEKYDTSEERMKLVQNFRVSQIHNDKKDQETQLSKLMENPKMKELITQMIDNRKTPNFKPKDKTIFTSKDLYVESLTKWLPDSTEEERAGLMHQAKQKGASYVVETIESFEKTI